MNQHSGKRDLLPARKFSPMLRGLEAASCLVLNTVFCRPKNPGRANGGVFHLCPYVFDIEPHGFLDERGA